MLLQVLNERSEPREYIGEVRTKIHCHVTQFFELIAKGRPKVNRVQPILKEGWLTKLAKVVYASGYSL